MSILAPVIAVPALPSPPPLDPCGSEVAISQICARYCFTQGPFAHNFAFWYENMIKDPVWMVKHNSIYKILFYWIIWCNQLKATSNNPEFCNGTLASIILDNLKRAIVMFNMTPNTIGPLPSFQVPGFIPSDSCANKCIELINAIEAVTVSRPVIIKADLEEGPYQHLFNIGISSTGLITVNGVESTSANLIGALYKLELIALTTYLSTQFYYITASSTSSILSLCPCTVEEALSPIQQPI